MAWSSSSVTPRWRVILAVLFAITMLNYVAQIPYYIHFYGVHHAAPSLLGTLLLVVTCGWFLVGFVLARRGRQSGWWLLLGFFALEFAFYALHNLSGAFLRDLPMNDPLFLVVSLIGYLNTISALVAFILLIRARFWSSSSASDGTNWVPSAERR